MVSFYLFLPSFKINKTFRHIQVKHIILQSAVTFPPHSQESHKALSSNQKDSKGNPRSLPLAMRVKGALALPRNLHLLAVQDWQGWFQIVGRGRLQKKVGSLRYVVWNETNLFRVQRVCYQNKLVTLGALEGTRLITVMSDGSEPLLGHCCEAGCWQQSLGQGIKSFCPKSWNPLPPGPHLAQVKCQH